MEWDIYLVSAVLACALLLLIGAIVAIKDIGSTKNRFFCCLVISLSFWTMSNYLSNSHSVSFDVAMIANRAVFVGASATVLSLFLLLNSMLDSRFMRKYKKFIFSIAALTVATSLTPWIVDGISEQGAVYAIDFGILAPAYFVMLAVEIVLMFFSLIEAARSASDADRGRIVSLRNSVCVSMVILMITNYVLPVLGLFHLTPIGSLAILYMAVSFAYLITNYGLFRLRPAIFKMMGGMALMVVLSILYNLLIISVAMVVLNGLGVDWLESLFLAIAIAVANMLFRPIKDRIDRHIRKLSQNNYYEIGEVLDRINQILISSTSADEVVGDIVSVLKDNVRSEYCSVVLCNDQEDVSAVYGDKVFRKKEIGRLLDLAKSDTETLKVLDYMAWGNNQLKDAMSGMGVEVLVRMDMRMSAETVDVGVKNREMFSYGYMLLGAKRSGVNYTRKDIGLLSSVGKGLAIGLHNALQFDYISDFNEVLTRDISVATRDLRRKNSKLRKLDIAKDEFVNMASHQLRTPLTSIKGYLSMMLDGDVGSVTPIQRKFLTEAYESSNKMVHIINDFLNVSRIQTGKFVLDKSWVQLDRIVRDEALGLQEVAKASRLGIKCDIEKSDKYLMEVDESKVRQVISNLIDNAIFYSTKETIINVSLKVEGRKVVFKVKDTGIGVPRSEQKNLFQKFFRASNAKKRRPDGTGVGLYLANRIITASKGGMIFSSTEGEGSTFGFWLPISKKRG